MPARPLVSKRKRKKRERKSSIFKFKYKLKINLFMPRQIPASVRKGNEQKVRTAPQTNLEM